MMIKNEGNIFEDAVAEFVQDNLNDIPVSVHQDPFWKGLKVSGTEIWLDTGDIDQVRKLWTAEMSALTTNNTLLNKEVQKGIYDEYISKAKAIVKGLPVNQQVVEIAFMLNARHGLRLAKIFNTKVSVELHTDTANDFNAIISYGKRLHAINPEQFIIKVPYTAAGLIAARRLGEMGIPINFTLGFSARQNALAAIVAKPVYINVFLGRLDAYFKNAGIEGIDNAGVTATVNTQVMLSKLRTDLSINTKLIAASMREAEQLEKLAGVDVMTVPAKVASGAHDSLSGVFISRVGKAIAPVIGQSYANFHFEKLWAVSPDEMSLAYDLDNNTPSTGNDLIDRARRAGCGDMFPRLDVNALQRIKDDGKIPSHEYWQQYILKGDIASDTLLNLAGLYSFTADQQQLDARIEGIIRS